MKILDIKFKSLPTGDIAHVVDSLYAASVVMSHHKRKIHVGTAKTLAFAGYLKVDDFILDLLTKSDSL